MTGGDVLALADALGSQAVRQGEQAPTVRGADWQTATVTAVDVAPGTVDCGAIRARRAPAYVLPQVGDVCVLLRSGIGNWLAMPPMTSAPGGWQPLTLGTGYRHPGHGAVPALLAEGRRVTLRGRIDKTDGAAIVNGATLATIPAQHMPGGAAGYGFAAVRDTGSYPAVVRVDITTAGIVRIVHTSPAVSWIQLEGAHWYTS